MSTEAAILPGTAGEGWWSRWKRTPRSFRIGSVILLAHLR